LAWPVVSVGSLSAGGAGKTPVVIALAELLREQGWAVDVLSRGYGRAGDRVAQVDPEARNATRRFGDEPVLIARRTRVPVWVGSERFAAGRAAETASGVQGRDVHLMDDGFQHRQLARAVDVVLVTEEDLDDALLPAGNRRERLTALRRADVVVLREEERERIEPQVRGLMRADTALWTVRRELRFPDTAGGLTAGARPMAFCAIARPEGFWAMLEQAGCMVAAKVAFGDHYGYKPADVEQLVSAARDCGATGFLTTEKDAVKLVGSDAGAMLKRLREVGPLVAVKLEATFVDAVEVARGLEGRLR
jgi:tetraacyldisaccharide 4'-kinase